MHIEFVVCDDEPLAAEAVRIRAGEIFAAAGVSYAARSYQDPQAFFRSLPGEPCDLVFLDIDMPGTDGIELAKALAETGNRKPGIIFVTNRTDRVFETFEVRPFRFLRKENLNETIERAVLDYIGYVRENGTEILFELSNRTSLCSVRLKDILYIESRRNVQYLRVGYQQEPVRLNATMDELEAKLSGYDVVRIHRGYLVNLQHVRKIGKDEVVLKDGTSLLVSRRRFPEIQEKYLQYLYRTGR